MFIHVRPNIFHLLFHFPNILKIHVARVASCVCSLAHSSLKLGVVMSVMVFVFALSFKSMIFDWS